MSKWNRPMTRYTVPVVASAPKAGPVVGSKAWAVREVIERNRADRGRWKAQRTHDRAVWEVVPR